MKYNAGIELGLRNGVPHEEIARKIFLCYPTNVFVDNEEVGFEILNQISIHFRVPFMSVQVVGSSKVGFSYHQDREFVPGESDLDIAIIDTSLFVKYSEIVFRVTNGYTSRQMFEQGSDSRFTKGLAKGMMRPDLMPRCQEKNEWFDFFRQLSSRYYRLFDNINGGIYASYFFFENKQAGVVVNYTEYKRRGG